MSRYFAVLFTALSFLPMAAQSQVQRLELIVQREFNRGGVFALKQEVQRQHRIDLNRFELDSVIIQAKSAQGQGVIALQMGRQQTRSSFIPGNPRDYRDNYPTTFSPIRLNAPAASAQQDWLLSFQGNIKVQNIRLNLRPIAYRPTPPRPGPRPGPNPFPAPGAQLQFQNQGEFRLEKFIESSKNFNLRTNNVKVVQIQPRKNDANISQARAILSDGREVFLDSLTGYIREGRTAQFTFPAFNGVSVQSLYISGTTSGLIGSRAELKVEIGVLGY